MIRINHLAPGRLRVWIAIITLFGLILRIAAAHGSLWLDEAWSAVLADHVGTPLGVFVQINHDNNHHLNSLWLQMVGLGAPPLLARGLSVTTGTLGIYVAGRIGARRGPLAGLATALLFAVSPAMVSLGSEARGYAPMLLTVLIAFWHIDRFLDGDPDADRPVTLAICFFVGALAQLTMVFAACALIGWPLATLWRRDGWRAAAAGTARLLGPALAALLLALAVAFAPVLLGSATFRLGSVAAFSLPGFAGGLSTLFRYALGGPPIVAFAFGAASLWSLRKADPLRLPFYLLALLAFPLAVLALRPLNAEHARYYLLAGFALLLLVGQALPSLLLRSGGARVLGLCAIGFICGSSLATDAALIRDERGDVAPAIAALAARAPGGTRVTVARESGLALMQVAAAEARYPVRLDRNCGAARFVFAEWFAGETPDRIAKAQCGAGLRAIASATSHGFSGQNWTLYERVG